MGRKEAPQAGAAAAAGDADLGGPKSDSWNSKDEKVHVTENDGFDIELTAKLDCPPEMVYSILADPDPTNIFRNLKSVLYRHTLSDDGLGRRHFAVGHRAVAKFLFISITFDTDLVVWEDRKQGKIRFEVKEDGKGAMKAFNGNWNIQPFSESAMSTIRMSSAMAAAHKHTNASRGASALASTSPSWLTNTGAMFKTFAAPSSPSPCESLVTLHQRIVPRSMPPPGIKRLLRRLCAKQIQDMMKDVRGEVCRRKEAEAEAEAEAKRKASGGAAAAASITFSRGHNIWSLAKPIFVVSL